MTDSYLGVDSNASADSSVTRTGTLDFYTPTVNVGNTGLNLGAITLPMQANPANGGMGLDIASRWVDMMARRPGDPPLPTTSTNPIVNGIGSAVVPIAIGIGALVLIAILMHKRH